MDKNFQRVRKKAEKVFAAYDKGERSPRLRAQLSEVRQELEAFLKKTKAQRARCTDE